jgi:hypothetical protein
MSFFIFHQPLSQRNELLTMSCRAQLVEGLQKSVAEDRRLVGRQHCGLGRHLREFHC